VSHCKWSIERSRRSRWDHRRCSGCRLGCEPGCLRRPWARFFQAVIDTGICCRVTVQYRGPTSRQRGVRKW